MFKLKFCLCTVLVSRTFEPTGNFIGLPQQLFLPWRNFHVAYGVACWYLGVANSSINYVINCKNKCWTSRHIKNSDCRHLSWSHFRFSDAILNVLVCTILTKWSCNTVLHGICYKRQEHLLANLFKSFNHITPSVLHFIPQGNKRFEYWHWLNR